MNYNENAKCCSVGVTQEPIESLVDLMKGTNEVGIAIRAMAEKINGNLFGVGNSACCDGKNESPMCFRDALEMHRRTLELAANELSLICSMLGM